MTATIPAHTTAPAAPAGRRLAHEARAVRVVWQREMLHLWRSPSRIAVALVQPVVYLLVLGTGLGTVLHGTAIGTSYRTYLFPGILLMTVQGPAIAAGVSIVWDREVGFLREMLVAPVHRASLLLGKCLGGAAVATCQGALVLALAGTAGIPYDLRLFTVLTAELALTALALTAAGAVAAVTIRRVQAFQAILSFALMPMLFLSGAMFPLTALPPWLATVTLLNPLTYSVDLLRQAVAAALPTHSPATGPHWAGWPVSPLAELGITATLCATALAVAAHRFSRSS
ncbi:ABC transporter permease [Streptomyces sp. NPDC093085]|uniref:ABC transporter permease n=1 Tax=Streptomyces sp. NPDC093085 TaxID=3155068 RepID=UPI00343EE725